MGVRLFRPFFTILRHVSSSSGNLVVKLLCSNVLYYKLQQETLTYSLYPNFTFNLVLSVSAYTQQYRDKITGIITLYSISLLSYLGVI